VPFGVNLKPKLNFVGDIAESVYDQIVNKSSWRDDVASVKDFAGRIGRPLNLPDAAELRKRNLGFLVAPPQFGLAPKKMVRIAGEEAERFAQGVAGISGLKGKPGPGDVAKAVPPLAGTRFLGRELWEGIGGPATALDRSAGAVVGNLNAQAMRQLDPDYYDANKDYYDSMQFSRGKQEILGAMTGAFLPATAGSKLFNKLPVAAKVPAELVYPGGAMQAGVQLSEAAARGVARGATGAVKVGAYGVGRTLERSAPRLAETLEKPHLGRAITEAVPEWERQVYIRDGGNEVGLVIDRSKLNKLLQTNRQTYHRLAAQVKEGTGLGRSPNAAQTLETYKANTDALQALHDSMVAMQHSTVTIKEGSLYDYAKRVAALTNAREDAGHAAVDIAAANKALEKYEQLLDYTPEYVPSTVSKPKAIGAFISKAIFGEKAADTALRDELAGMKALQEEHAEAVTGAAKLAEAASARKRDAASLLKLEDTRVSPRVKGTPNLRNYANKTTTAAAARSRVHMLETALERATKAQGVKLGSGAIVSSGSKSLTTGQKTGTEAGKGVQELQDELAIARSKLADADQAQASARRGLHTALLPTGSARHRLDIEAKAATRAATQAETKAQHARDSLVRLEKSFAANTEGSILERGEEFGTEAIRHQKGEGRRVLQVSESDVEHAADRLAKAQDTYAKGRTPAAKKAVDRARSELRKLKVALEKGGKAEAEKLAKAREIMEKAEQEANVAHAKADALNKRMDAGEGLDEVADQVRYIEEATARHDTLMGEARELTVAAADARLAVIKHQKAIAEKIRPLRERLPKATRALVDSYLDSVFRPADMDEVSGTYYALDNIKLRGNKKDPSSFTVAAVLVPIRPNDMPLRAEEVRRVARLSQVREDMADAEAVLEAAHRKASVAKDPAIRAAAKKERTEAQAVVTKLRAEAEQLEGAAPVSARADEIIETRASALSDDEKIMTLKQVERDTKSMAQEDFIAKGEEVPAEVDSLIMAARAAINQKDMPEIERILRETGKIAGEAQEATVETAARARGSITIPLEDIDQKFVRYKLTPRNRAKVATGAGVSDPSFRRAVADRQLLEEQALDLDRQISVVESQIKAANQLRDDATLPATDPTRRAAAAQAEDLGEQHNVLRKERELNATQTERAEAKLAGLDRTRAVQVIETKVVTQEAKDAALKADAAVVDAQRRVDELTLPMAVGSKAGPNGQRIAIVPGYTQGPSMEEFRAGQLANTNKIMLDMITERVKRSGPLSDSDLADVHLQVTEMYQRGAGDTRFFEGMGPILQRIDEVAPRASVAEAFRMMVARYDDAETAIDKDAFHRGIPNWFRRVVGGTGYRTSSFEGLTATYFNGEAASAMHAQTVFGGISHNFTQAVRKYLSGKVAAGEAGTATVRQIKKGMAAGETLRAGRKQPESLAGGILGWPAYRAANLLKIGNNERLVSAFLRPYARAVDSPAWKAQFAAFDDLGGEHATTAELRKLVHAHASGDFVSAALYPELFDLRRMDPGLQEILRHYRESYYALENGAKNFYGVNWSHAPMVRFELRETLAPDGRAFARAGGDPRKLMFRTHITDLMETARRMEVQQQGKGDLRRWLLFNEGTPSAISGRAPGGTREFPLSLERVYLTGQDSAEALPAIVLRKLNESELQKRMAKQLANPDNPSILRGPDGWNQQLGPNDFKGETLAERTGRADDWKKMVGMLQRDRPTGGLGKIVDTARRGFNAVGLSVLIGDMSFFGIQWPFMLALNPRAGFKAMGHFFGLGGNVWSDEKFAAWTASKMDMIAPMIERGSGLGMEAFVGASFRSGSMWEHLPLMRPFGKFAKYVNDVQFNRMMLVFKVMAMETQLDIVHAMRMVGPAAAVPYIDGLPGLKKLNESVDLMNATPVEVFDSLIRLQNNQFGGVPRSQSQIGTVRDFVEHMTLIVPGFFRARAGLIGQASRAARNPSSVEGWLAMNIMAREAMYTQMLGAGVSAMTGNLDQWIETRDNPDEGTFFAAMVGDAAAGEYVKVAPSPGAQQLYIRLTKELGKMAIQGAGGEGKPDAGGLKEVITRFAKGRQNPALAVIVEQYEGKDFFGRNRKDLRSRAVGGLAGIAPIWMGELMTSAEDQAYSGEFDPQALAVDTAGEFLGYSHKPADPSTQLNNRFRGWQERAGGLNGREPIDWWDATSELRTRAKDADPDLAHAEALWLKDKARKETEKDKFADAVFATFETKMTELDTEQAQNTRLAEGGAIDFEEWAERQKELGQARASNAEDLRQDLLEAGIDIEESGKGKLEQMQIGGKGPLVALALAEYRAVELPTMAKDYTLEDGTSIVEQVPDFDKLEAEKQAILDRYPKAVQEEIKAIVGPKDPVEIRWKASHKDLDAYLGEIPKYRDMSVTQGQYVDYLISSMRAVEKRVRQEGITITRKQLYLKVLGALAKQGKVDRSKSPLAAKAYAWALDNDERLMGRNPDNLRFLRDHSDMLMFFPWLRGEVPQKMWRFLPEAVRAQIDLPAIEERELGPTGVAAVA
jgi:hypothetical protein